MKFKEKFLAITGLSSLIISSLIGGSVLLNRDNRPSEIKTLRDEVLNTLHIGQESGVTMNMLGKITSPLVRVFLKTYDRGIIGISTNTDHYLRTDFKDKSFFNTILGDISTHKEDPVFNVRDIQNVIPAGEIKTLTINAQVSRVVNSKDVLAKIFGSQWKQLEDQIGESTTIGVTINMQIGTQFGSNIYNPDDKLDVQGDGFVTIMSKYKAPIVFQIPPSIYNQSGQTGYPIGYDRLSQFINDISSLPKTADLPEEK